jgi:hypothetical protein
VRWTLVALVAACAATPPPVGDAPGAPGAPALPADAERHYAIWLGGARIGTARETERWAHAGVVVRRTEAMQFLRGDVPVALATTIEITADRRLVPSRVTWTEAAQAARHGEAVRDPAGWTVTDDAGVRRLPASAIPAELAPLVVRRDGRFAGRVFLPARDFAAGTGRIDPVAPGRLVARLVLAPGALAQASAGTRTRVPSEAGVMIEAAAETAIEAEAEATNEATAEATIDLGDDAMPARVIDGEGVIATRITAAEAALPFTPVDLIAATSIPLLAPPGEASDGSPTEPPRASPRRHLVLEGELAVPPVPGQASRATRGGTLLELSSRLHGGLPPGPRGADRTRELVALVAQVRGRIAPDLATHPTSARAAVAATAGDCTTFALVYAALAADRAIPTRVVTGFRVDGDRLVRHRWAVSWTGRAWIAIDAAFGAVPAGGDLVGLAVHDADDLGLVAGEAALTRVRAAAWR